MRAREIIDTEDSDQSDSDSNPDSSQEDGRTSGEIEDWVRNTQSHQAPLQYYDIESRKWMSKDDGLSENFMMELQVIAGSSDSNPNIDCGTFAENDMNISESAHQDRDMANDPGFDGFEVDTNLMTEDPVSLPRGNYPKEFRNLDELCTDVMKMHGDEQNTRVRARRSVDTEYEYSWTGI